MGMSACAKAMNGRVRVKTEPLTPQMPATLLESTTAHTNTCMIGNQWVG